MVPLSRRAILWGSIAVGSSALVRHGAAALQRSRSIEAHHRLAERLRGPPPAAHTRRLDEELEVIGARGWWSSLDALLVVAEAARRRGVFVHHDVGGWTSSLVAFGLGLTVLDPVVHRLPFERVMHSPGSPYLALAISPLAPLGFVTDVKALVPGTTLELRKYGRDVGTALVRLPGPLGHHEVQLVRYVELNEVQQAVGQGFDVEQVDLNAPLGVWRPPPAIDDELASVLNEPTFEALTQALVLARLEGYPWISDDERHELWRAFLFGDFGTPRSCEPYVSPTRGLLLYQEQLTAMVRDFAGVSSFEAHALRRAVHTARVKRIAPWRDRFIHGAQRHSAMADGEAADVFDWLVWSYRFSLARTAAVTQAALWRWRAEAGRYLSGDARDARRRTSTKFGTSPIVKPKLPWQ